MTTVSSSETSVLQRAYAAVQKAQRRLDEVERARKEPIAIVGMGCRFPGPATNPAEFWSLLRDGVDGVVKAPPDRWTHETVSEVLRSLNPDSSGDVFAGFLDHVETFDARFFGISPREATCIDPQQRLLLEVAWEALEDSGHPPESLAGSQTGVFVGIINQSSDYFWLQSGTAAAVDAYSATGTAHSVSAGRVAYLLDLHGPAMAVDTACSSSLVSVHLACQSLRSGESDLALAAGVNLRLSPEFLFATSRMGTASPSGRCRAF
ncbi:MAG TPA: polyketide synthase, partial [Chloroflexota bacterium]